MTLFGWLYPDRNDKAEAREPGPSDLLNCDSAHKAVVEIGGVKVPLTKEQATDLSSDLMLVLLALHHDEQDAAA